MGALTMFAFHAILVTSLAQRIPEKAVCTPLKANATGTGQIDNEDHAMLQVALEPRIRIGPLLPNDTSTGTPQPMSLDMNPTPSHTMNGQLGDNDVVILKRNETLRIPDQVDYAEMRHACAFTKDKSAAFCTLPTRWDPYGYPDNFGSLYIVSKRLRLPIWALFDNLCKAHHKFGHPIQCYSFDHTRQCGVTGHLFDPCYDLTRTAGMELRFQDDGNLLLVNNEEEVIWKTNTEHTDATYLVLQGDCNLVILSSSWEHAPDMWSAGVNCQSKFVFDGYSAETWDNLWDEPCGFPAATPKDPVLAPNPPPFVGEVTDCKACNCTGGNLFRYCPDSGRTIPSDYAYLAYAEPSGPMYINCTKVWQAGYLMNACKLGPFASGEYDGGYGCHCVGFDSDSKCIQKYGHRAA